MVAWQRDIDEVRNLLLKIDGGQQSFCALPRPAAEAMMLPHEHCLPEPEARKLAYHLELLESAGFARFARLENGNWLVRGLTWAGHEFLDNIRSDAAWSAAKRQRELLGGFSMEILARLARELMCASVFGPPDQERLNAG